MTLAVHGTGYRSIRVWEGARAQPSQTGKLPELPQDVGVTDQMSATGILRPS